MKVKGLALVGLSALAQPQLTKGGQPPLAPSGRACLVT